MEFEKQPLEIIKRVCQKNRAIRVKIDVL
jgi:hypothetical protein